MILKFSNLTLFRKALEANQSWTKPLCKSKISWSKLQQSLKEYSGECKKKIVNNGTYLKKTMWQVTKFSGLRVPFQAKQKYIHEGAVTYIRASKNFKNSCTNCIVIFRKKSLRNLAEQGDSKRARFLLLFKYLLNNLNLSVFVQNTLLKQLNIFKGYRKATLGCNGWGSNLLEMCVQSLKLTI